MSGPKDTRPAPALSPEAEQRRWLRDRRRQRDRRDQDRVGRAAPRLGPADYDRVAAALPREGPGLTATQVAQRLNVDMDDEAQRTRLLAALNNGAQVRVLVTYIRRPGQRPEGGERTRR